MHNPDSQSLWLIHVKHGNNILAYIHLLTYCIRYGFNSTPTTGSTLVGFNFFFIYLSCVEMNY